MSDGPGRSGAVSPPPLHLMDMRSMFIALTSMGIFPTACGRMEDKRTGMVGKTGREREGLVLRGGAGDDEVHLGGVRVEEHAGGAAHSADLSNGLHRACSPERKAVRSPSTRSNRRGGCEQGGQEAHDHRLTDLVVDHHDRDQRRVGADCARHLVEVKEPVLRAGCGGRRWAGRG